MMDVYVLDDLLRRVEVFDRYKSFIWTERFASIGDFELVIHTDSRSLTHLTVGRRLSIRDSMRVMEIETIEKKDTDEGRFLTITGRSLEKIFEERSTRRPSAGLNTDNVYRITDRPGNIVRTMFDNVCRNNTYVPTDNIPFIQPGTLIPAGTIPEPEESVNLEVSNTATLYTFMKDICDAYNLGFRLIRNFDFSQLYFEVYSGNNLTTGQTSVDPVVFSPDLDNLADVTELNSKAQYKNVAYVYAKNGYEIVYAADASPATSGFDRRVLIVDASDVTEPAGATLTNILIQKGTDALAKNRALFAFDGEVPQNSEYRYGTDYQLGDLIEMQNSEGASNWMRVTEQIFVSDQEGERSYPTLALDLLITPGSWYSWDYNQVWDEAEGTWDEV